MLEKAIRPVEDWQELESGVTSQAVSSQVFTSKLVTARLWGDSGRRRGIAYLRAFDERARSDRSRRETIQLIAPGRLVFGDRTNVGPVDGPFARTLGVAP